MQIIPSVFARELDTYSDATVGETGVVTLKGLETLFTNVINVILTLAGLALFLMFVAAGFSFLFSGGDPKKLEGARGTLTNAIIGLVVVVAAYLVLQLIGKFTGYTGITTFRVGPTPTP